MQPAENGENKKLYFLRRDKIVLQYLVNVNSQLEVRSLTNGSFIQKIDFPSGAIDSSWGRKFHNELFFRVVSFLTPGIIYRVDLSHTPYKTEIVREIKVPGFNASEFVTKQVFYQSYDGTKIPMFIVHKENLVFNSNASTLIYGYGGFDINVLPTFSSKTIVFLQNFDGVYAVPNIRGGRWGRKFYWNFHCLNTFPMNFSEYGSKWHDGGRLLNKQNVFDDFQAAAEYLINEKYTTASKIAINGASNGGLLVAACANQRPELYGAAVAQVGYLSYTLSKLPYQFTNENFNSIAAFTICFVSKNSQLDTPGVQNTVVLMMETKPLSRIYIAFRRCIMYVYRLMKKFNIQLFFSPLPITMTEWFPYIHINWLLSCNIKLVEIRDKWVGNSWLGKSSLFIAMFVDSFRRIRWWSKL